MIPSPALPLKGREHDPNVTLPLKGREHDRHSLGKLAPMPARGERR